MEAVAPDTPREEQTIRLPESRLAGFREWALEGTALTAAARVTDPDGRVALVRNCWSDGWLPPGGAVEAGEEPSAAARREVREETGLTATVGEAVVAVDQSYVPEGGPGKEAFSATYVLYEATAAGMIPGATELGVADDEIEAADWFVDLPSLEDELLRPHLERR